MEAHSAEVRAVIAAFLTAVVVHAVVVRSAVVLVEAVRSVEVLTAAIAAVLAEVVHTVVARMATVVIANSEFQHPDLSIHHTLNFAH